ncbi:hypothetical protein ABT214_14845 [Micromonospora purpureochromogenes]|uniref:GlsB/YeaQ/YmgE family stress response membrane protein n=1 Tax=Micromonospora TaxID=1873 RepID=UPI001B39C240|nr:hypothetical protein [Micromonospora sp. U56]MBQ0895521.1 hypothetical protein [Micromonospora sp. U56]
MSVSALLSALGVGLGIGLVGRLVLPGPKAAPVWLTVALGVAAALLGSVTARLIGVDVEQWAPHRLLAQVGFAVPAVVLGVFTAGRRRTPERAGHQVDRSEDLKGGGRMRGGRPMRGQA